MTAAIKNCLSPNVCEIGTNERHTNGHKPERSHVINAEDSPLQFLWDFSLNRGTPVGLHGPMEIPAIKYPTMMSILEDGNANTSGAIAKNPQMRTATLPGGVSDGYALRLMRKLCPRR